MKFSFSLDDYDLNTALALIKSRGGGEIVIPPTTYHYKIAPTITPPFPSFTIRGFGGCVNAALNPVGSILQFDGLGNAFNISNQLAINFENFCLLGNPKATHGIVTNQVQNSIFNQVWTYGFSGIGFYCLETYECMLNACTAMSCGTGYAGLDDNGTTIYNGYFARNRVGLHNPSNCIGTVVESNLTNGILYDQDDLHSSLTSVHVEANGFIDDQEYANIFSKARTFLVMNGRMELHSAATLRKNRMTHFGGFFSQLQAEGTYNIAVFGKAPPSSGSIPENWEFGSLLSGSIVCSRSPSFRTQAGDWNNFSGIQFI